MNDGIRQSEPESRTFPQLGFRTDLTAHFFDDHLADGKSQACPLCKAVQFYETVEHKIFLLRFYATSRISDVE